MCARAPLEALVSYGLVDFLLALWWESSGSPRLSRGCRAHVVEDSRPRPLTIQARATEQAAVTHSVRPRSSRPCSATKRTRPSEPKRCVNTPEQIAKGGIAEHGKAVDSVWELKAHDDRPRPRRAVERGRSGSTSIDALTFDLVKSAAGR